MTHENSYSIERVKHLLTELPFFDEFDAHEFDLLVENMSMRSFDAGTCLFTEGDIGDYLFLIIAGEVEVRLQAGDSSQRLIAKFGPGGSVGEMSLIDDYPRSATVIITQPSELLLLSRKRLDALCADNPVTGLKFIKGLARNLSTRLRKTNGRFADIA